MALITTDGSGGSSTQPDRRLEILDVALDLFSQGGYEGTALRQIAERMGFSVAALYYHFKAKGELLSLLAQPHLDELETIIVDAEAEGHLTPRRGQAVLERYLDLLLANRTLTYF